MFYAAINRITIKNCLQEVKAAPNVGRTTRCQLRSSHSIIQAKLYEWFGLDFPVRWQTSTSISFSLSPLLLYCRLHLNLPPLSSPAKPHRMSNSGTDESCCTTTFIKFCICYLLPQQGHLNHCLSNPQVYTSPPYPSLMASSLFHSLPLVVQPVPTCIITWYDGLDWYHTS